MKEIMRGDVTLDELKQYRNTLNQRKDYYRRWFKKRADGVEFRDTRHILEMTEAIQKTRNVENELEIVNGLINNVRNQAKKIEQSL